MQSTFSGIELGKRSLIAHTKSMSTLGHNITNASTEGYSRQRVRIETFNPLYAPYLNRENTPGQLGQGMKAASVERIKDTILEGRIVSQSNKQGYWEVRDKYILMTEQVYHEPGDYSVRAAMDKFWEGWQEVSIYPNEMVARQSVLERGNTLMDTIHGRYDALKQTRDMVETEITVAVTRINTILTDVAALNEKIVKVKAMGDNPNDFLDRRDLLVRNLSEIINITVDNRDSDEFQIHTSGYQLIQGKAINYLSTEVDPANEGYSRVTWQRNGEDTLIEGGKLASFLELRDKDLREEIQKLDVLTINFIDNINDLHKRAWGANGKTGIEFFREYPAVTSVEGNYDRSGDGVFDSSYIFRITGSNSLNPQELIGIRGTMTLAAADENIEIDYYPTDTVQDVIDRINTSPAKINATLDADGYLTFRAMESSTIGNPDFVIGHIEDSGDFLTGYTAVLAQSGPEGAYDWQQANAVTALYNYGDEAGRPAQYAVAPLSHPSGWIEINKEITSDPMSIGAGFGENGRMAQAGDGSAALAIAALRNKPLMVGKFTSFDQYFSSTIADIGLKGEQAKTALETQNLIMKELEDLNQSISGVNIDEELSNMIKFNHGYSAAARFISQYNDMLDIIINRLKM